MKTPYWLIGIVLLVQSHISVEAETADIVVLENSRVRLEINRFGGAISSFTLNSMPDLNPFNWVSGRWQKNDISRKEGYFICFDRFGHPSEEEKKAGIPFHGEATSVPWKVIDQKKVPQAQRLRMSCKLPLSGMMLERDIILYTDTSVCRINDRFTNGNPGEKRYSILHHPTVAPPFLDPTVLIDCNGGNGFVATRKADDQQAIPEQWPVISADPSINLRSPSPHAGLPFNMKCVPEAEIGWACVANASKGLMVGYCWNPEDYPWMRHWQNWKDGQPDAFSLEFGTSPFQYPFDETDALAARLGLPLLDRLAPGESIETSIHLFLMPVGKSYEGTRSVQLEKGRLTIDIEGEQTPRTIALPKGTP